MYHDSNDILDHLGLTANEKKAAQVRELLLLLVRRAEAGYASVRRAKGDNRPRFYPLPCVIGPAVSGQGHEAHGAHRHPRLRLRPVRPQGTSGDREAGATGEGWIR